MIAYGEDLHNGSVKPNQGRGHVPAHAGRLWDIPTGRRMSQDYRRVKRILGTASAPTVANREISGSSRMRLEPALALEGSSSQLASS